MVDNLFCILFYIIIFSVLVVFISAYEFYLLPPSFLCHPNVWYLITCQPHGSVARHLSAFASWAAGSELLPVDGEVWGRKSYPEGMLNENGQWVERLHIEATLPFLWTALGWYECLYLEKYELSADGEQRGLSSFLLSPCKLLYCVIPSAEFCFTVLGCHFSEKFLGTLTASLSLLIAHIALTLVPALYWTSSVWWVFFFVVWKFIVCPIDRKQLNALWNLIFWIYVSSVPESTHRKWAWCLFCTPVAQLLSAWNNLWEGNCCSSLTRHWHRSFSTSGETLLVKLPSCLIMHSQKINKTQPTKTKKTHRKKKKNCNKTPKPEQNQKTPEQTTSSKQTKKPPSNLCFFSSSLWFCFCFLTVYSCAANTLLQ